MKYDVIVEPKLESLILEVNQKITQGWEPSGSLIVESNSEGGVMYIQPVIRK